MALPSAFAARQTVGKGATVWMPIFIGDHLAETSDFDAVEQGAYLFLLMRLWQSDGRLPLSDAALAKIAHVSRPQWTRIKPTVMRLFEAGADGYSHARMSAEITKARENIEKRKRAGIASGASRRGEHMFNTCSTHAPTHVEPRAGNGEGDGPFGQSNSLTTVEQDIFQ